MNSYNVDRNNEFYCIVKTIVNDKDTRKIIYKISQNQIYELVCYLNNEMYYQLVIFLKHITDSISNYNLNANKISGDLISYNNICQEKNIKMSDILFMCKSLLMKAGSG